MNFSADAIGARWLNADPFADSGSMPAFGFITCTGLEIDPAAPGTAFSKAVFDAASDSPDFFCMWNGQFTPVGTRTSANANLGFDANTGFAFVDSQPGPGNANRADLGLGFHGGSFPIIRTHVSSTGVFGLLFFDDGTRAPPAQPTLAGILAQIANVTDPAAKAALTAILSVIDSSTGNGLCKAT